MFPADSYKIHIPLKGLKYEQAQKLQILKNLPPHALVMSSTVHCKMKFSTVLLVNRAELL